MDVSYVNPFIKVTIDVFLTLLNLDLHVGAPKLSNDTRHTFDVSGVIGLSGEARGIIALSFPKIIALKISSQLHGKSVKIIDNEVTDAIGELVNIVAGNAKQFLSAYKLQISLPNVVIGQNHQIAVEHGVPLIVVPMCCDMGDFAIEVALKTK